MNKTLILVILILSTSVAMMSTDLYAPSLAHLPEYFGTSTELVQLTVSLNALAYCLATLVHGPLSERFGRRPILLYGLLAFTVFSLGCALSQTIGQLIGARILQGLAAAVEGVVILAIIRDYFDDKEQVRALAFFGMASSFTPAVAPIIGGYVHVYFGWRMNFYGLAGIAAIVTALIGLQLEETGRRDPDALAAREIIKDYLQLLRSRAYLSYTLTTGATVGFFFAFITAGPFILINNHGLPTQYFGYFQLIAVVAYALGSLLADRLVSHVPILTILKLGIFVSVAGSLFLVCIVFGGHESLWTLGIALALVAFGDGPVFATTPSLAMNATGSRTGPAAALLVAMELGVGSLAALGVTVLHDGSSRPLAIITAALGMLLIAAYLLRPRSDHGGHGDVVGTGGK